MDHKKILSIVNELMTGVFDEVDLVATEETTADDVADWDSTNHIRLIMAIEETFKITFSSDEITAPQNVGELVDLISSKLAA
ncbi:acyl carrier protein [Mesorhizobium sophorae]|uniref:acyl carrier protein n=1 Tax=Mesorhizobium sophorae TaxID=1300294 RepID=UPI00197F1583|nr:acyl carrier protein [Mesorhizobium sophorae]